MAFCSQNPNAIIPHTVYTCAEALRNSFTLAVNKTYLRPNTGGALLPWIYTVVIILIHLPVVVIRVIRWEVVQSWCIVFAVFTVAIVTQSYVSTRFDPAEILIWTPIILVIDAGSMIQVFYLVIEAKKRRVGDRIFLVDPPRHGQHPETNGQHPETNGQHPETNGQHTETNGEGTQLFPSLLTRWQGRRHGSNTNNTNLDNNINLENYTNSDDNTNSDDKNGGGLDWYKDPAIWSATFAALSFIAVFVLQIFGLVKAVRAIQPDPPLVQWCSPLFQPSGIAALDGDGHAYPIAQSSNKGIGCIQIPGVWQRQWLKGTVAVLILELVFELLDIVILTLVNSNTKWRGVKMKRPWCSIFLGMVVLLVTLICGILFASELPPGITTRLMVIMESRGEVGSYDIELVVAGLRGTILGWSDGLFENWRSTYFGG